MKGKKITKLIKHKGGQKSEVVLKLESVQGLPEACAGQFLFVIWKRGGHSGTIVLPYILGYVCDV